MGKLRSGCKSGLLDYLQKLCPAQDDAPDVDVLILDGAAIVNVLKPTACQTFQDYASNIFIKYLENQLRKVRKIHIVCYVYKSDSLKCTTRSKRGKGIRRRVESTTRVLSNWQAFLRVDENKTELFEFLAEQSVTLGNGKQVISTKSKSVVCSQHRDDITDLSPCEQEETDTRIVLHAQDAAKRGYNRVMVQKVDTDVVVLCFNDGTDGCHRVMDCIWS